MTACVEALWAVRGLREGLAASGRDRSDTRHVLSLLPRLLVALLEAFNERVARRLCEEQPELVLAHLRHSRPRDDTEISTLVALCDLGRADSGTLSDCVRWSVHGSLFNLNPSRG